MPRALYDFRSDTVTRPTAAMLQAMIDAPTGDDVFGEDPTVSRLEEETASLLGAEAGLFVASGTMSNQLALRTHVGPLEEVMCDHRAHIHTWEVGGIHALCGASVAAAEPLAGQQFLDAAAVRLHARLDHSLYHQPVTKLLALENTLNGAVAPLSLVTEAVGAASSTTPGPRPGSGLGPESVVKGKGRAYRPGLESASAKPGPEPEHEHGPEHAPEPEPAPELHAPECDSHADSRQVVAARELGLATHLDGARLFNAAAASGEPLADYGAHPDTLLCPTLSRHRSQSRRRRRSRSRSLTLSLTLTLRLSLSLSLSPSLSRTLSLTPTLTLARIVSRRAVRHRLGLPL